MYLSVSACAIIGQLSGSYFTVRPAFYESQNVEENALKGKARKRNRKQHSAVDIPIWFLRVFGGKQAKYRERRVRRRLLESRTRLSDFIAAERLSNTVKKTKYEGESVNGWLKIFEVTNIPAAALDKLLGKFIKDVRKKNGGMYEPDSISSFQAFSTCVLKLSAESTCWSKAGPCPHKVLIRSAFVLKEDFWSRNSFIMRKN